VPKLKILFSVTVFYARGLTSRAEDGPKNIGIFVTLWLYFIIIFPVIYYYALLFFVYYLLFIFAYTPNLINKIWIARRFYLYYSNSLIFY